MIPIIQNILYIKGKFNIILRRNIIIFEWADDCSGRGAEAQIYSKLHINIIIIFYLFIFLSILHRYYRDA